MAILKRRRAYPWRSQPKLLTLPQKEWRTLMSMQYDGPFENPHTWLPSKILVVHYFTSQIHQILFSAKLNVPSTYLPTVHVPQFPVAYCTNHFPWPSIQFIFFFNGLHFRLRGWWRHPNVSYPIIRLNSSKCSILIRFKMDQSTSFCYNTQVCKTKITTG